MLPIEALEIPGFYEIPGYSCYVVSKEGKVFNRKKGHFLNGSINPDGYHNFRLRSDTNRILTWGLHRLMAYVFLHPGTDVSSLVVNHKNANKSDNRIENLEWVSYQGNAEHAGSLGLTIKCQPISVRDVDTGVVVKYPSIVACARVYGVSKDFINWRVKKGEAYVFPERKQYRGSHSDEPWYIPGNAETSFCSSRNSKRVLVRYLCSGATAEYPKITDLAEKLGVSLSTLSCWLKKEGQPVLPGYIQLKWADDDTPWREIDDFYTDIEKTQIKRIVKVTNDRSGEVVLYPSAVKCAQDLDLLPTTLHERLRSKGTKVFSDGRRYSYYSDKIQ